MLEPIYPVRAAVRKALEPGGAVARRLAGFAPNPMQIDFADRIAAACGAMDPASNEEGEITLLEAGTGVGKSLGAILPVALNWALTGERALLSTHTRHLQKQLLKETAPVVADAVETVTGRRPTFARRVGRGNFVDIDRVTELRDALRRTGDRAGEADQLEIWIDARPETFEEAEQLFGLTLPTDIAREDACVTAASRLSAMEPYLAHAREAREADIVVANHATLLLDARLWGRDIVAPENEERRRIAVFDEADALPGMARSMAERRLSLASIRALIDEADNGAADDGAAKQVLARLWNAAALLTAEGAAVLDARSGRAIREPSSELAERLSELGDRLQDDPLLRFDLDVLAADLEDIVTAIDGGQHEVAVATPSPTAAFPAIATVALDPVRILKRLWSRPRSGREPMLRAVVFTSATLTVPGESARFSGFMHRLGVDRSWSNFASHRSRSIEPEKFGEMGFVLARRDIPAPYDASGRRSAEWRDYVTSGIGEASRRGGRVLVLAASYDDVDDFAERLPEALAHRRGASLIPLLEAFVGDERAVLLSPAAWAGVDLPHLVDHVVIPRIPFPAPDEARELVLRRAWAARGVDERQAMFAARALAEQDMKRKLRQGLGRGVRRADDSCTVWLLDPRFPVPETLVRQRRLRLYQGLAERRSSLAQVIPRRFRVGLFASFNNAEVFAGSDEHAA